MTEGAARVGVAMPARMGLLCTSRIVRRRRTVLHRRESIGVHGKPASTGCKNLHQQSQKENREGGPQSLPQGFSLFVSLLQ